MNTQQTTTLHLLGHGALDASPPQKEFLPLFEVLATANAAAAAVTDTTMRRAVALAALDVVIVRCQAVKALLEAEGQ